MTRTHNINTLPKWARQMILKLQEDLQRERSAPITIYINEPMVADVSVMSGDHNGPIYLNQGEELTLNKPVLTLDSPWMPEEEKQKALEIIRNAVKTGTVLLKLEWKKP